jgi:hypothetical protein
MLDPRIRNSAEVSNDNFILKKTEKTTGFLVNEWRETLWSNLYETNQVKLRIVVQGSVNRCFTWEIPYRVGMLPDGMISTCRYQWRAVRSHSLQGDVTF